MTAIEDIAARIGPSVVGLQDGSRGGSGVLVAPGIVATLARNVHGDELTLVTGDGATHDATVLGIDPSVDLAVLRTGATAPPAAWSTAADPPRLGVKVYALADPGGRGLRVTSGSVASAPRGVRGPAGASSPAPSSTRRRCRAAPGAARSSTAPGAIVGLNALRRDGGLLLAWPATALRDARRRRWPPASGPRRAAWASPSSARARPAACAPRSASTRSTACSCAACRRAVRPTAQASPAATSSSGRTARRHRRSTTSMPRSTLRGAGGAGARGPARLRAP